ncbi:nitrate- and nitrite sensing domain-containing protein [Streptomyces sp. LB8]|uniref:sensor histidine kinase n=1 Tax=Streptomyces sp. LB8 TaxID=3042509 RepID=UPI00264A3702|nr:nitrate- and nitrite sensing domain-containing protein [Streptomyces sp. LB8]MDN5383763.1 nitrate- and nitrite sensing domain-containing protein [Streptomyces sp. LB8]
MRFRGKSIRRKIVALLLVPLLSLTAIWSFATVITGRQAARLFSASSVVERIAHPTEETVRALQRERRQTLVHLADPRASDGLAALRRSRAATDGAIARIRAHARNPEVRDTLDAGSEGRLTAVLDAFDGIDALRRSVEGRTTSRAQALDLYNRLIDPCYVLLANLHIVDDAELDKQYRALVGLARARELLSREDALLGSSLVVGTLTRADGRHVSDLVAQRTMLYEASLPLLPAPERDRYESFWQNAASAPLRTAEQAAVAAAPGAPRGVSAQSWDTAAEDVLDELGALDDEAYDRFQDRVRPVAMDIMLRAAVAGVLGLLAVVVSLVLSVRIGRGLVRDLKQLRRQALEASGVRLPDVMRRLSAGEQVDVETEVPRLEYDKSEIGEVGRALNTLQRAAVEAAAKQAELRAGVSEVFVNLARRSQVLLHKQLTLLDAMERRTEDPGELADLFRLDHLTTRMRRHAEGLVILSGAAPSRQWRKPVQLMDVVRAAVAEIEDYERIEVRRLPRVAVIGSAVADLTHLVAELLENATVFSPPHTAVQVLGERVANGFTLEIHDRGLGMTAEALADANLKLAETPEFALSDTDRLGLFVVGRLARRQKVRVSLQPSPYGGVTAVVFLPDALLTDDVPDTDGAGFRLDRERPAREGGRGAALSRASAGLGKPPASVLDGPVELEAPVDLDVLEDFPDAPGERDGGLGGVLRPHRTPDGRGRDGTGDGTGEGGGGAPAPLPRRRTPKLVSSHGRPVTGHRSRREAPDAEDRGSRGPEDRGEPRPDRRDESPPGPAAATGEHARPPALPRRVRRTAHAAGGPDDTGHGLADTPTSGPDALPRRVRRTRLVSQPGRSPERRTGDGPASVARDAEEMRSRMTSLQRGWQRGREESTTDGTAPDGGTARGTTARETAVQETAAQEATAQEATARGKTAQGKSAREKTAQETIRGDGR